MKKLLGAISLLSFIFLSSGNSFAMEAVDSENHMSESAEEKAEDMKEKFMKGDFNLVDLYEQMKSLKQMGSFRKLVDMIPGMGSLNMPKEMLDVQEGKLEKWKIAMDSMTKAELEDPEIISAERIDRVAAGSGIKVAEVRELLKQYRQSKKLMKMMKGEGDINKLMKKMGGKLPKGMMG